MPITLRPVTPLTGEDFALPIPFQMVPLGRNRFFGMTGNDRGAATLAAIGGNGSGGHVIAQLSGGHGGTNQLRLFGNTVGYQRMAWTDGSLIGNESLKVAVLGERRYRVAFRFVDDGGDQVTRRPHSDVGGMIRLANELLQPQANVTIENAGLRPLQLSQPLGRVTDDARSIANPSRDMRLLASHNDPNADVTVFFVREYDVSDLAGDQAGRSRAELGMIVLEDRTAGDHALAFVHELVHALGAAGHTSGPGDLMVTGHDRHNQPGRRLTAAQIWAVNPPRR